MNKIYVPKKELQAFMALSRVRPANSTFTYMSSQCNRLLMVDVSGKRVKLTHTNQLWFVQATSWGRKIDATDGYWCLDIDKLKQIDLPSFKGRDAEVPLLLDDLRASFVGEDYLRGINFDILTQKHKGGYATLSCDYDAALLSGVMAFYKATKKLVRVTFPQEYFQPLQVNALDDSCNALLMPVRR